MGKKKKKTQEKVVLFVFPEKKRGGSEETQFTVLPRGLPRRGERHGSLLTNLVAVALEVMNPPKAFTEGSWGVCSIAGAQKVFTKPLTRA